MRPLHRFVPILILTSWFSSSAMGQQGIVITVHGDQEITLAIPPVATPEGDPDGVATVIHNTVWRDLTLTGHFDMLDPDAYIDRTQGVEPDSFDFDAWSLVGAAALAKLRILPPGTCGGDMTKMCADVFVYYVVDERKLAGRRFRHQALYARDLAHAIAGVILESITGDSGLFRTHIAAVGSQSGNKEVYILGMDGRDVIPVTKNRSINLSPAWSRDGRLIAWTSYKRGNPDLYVKDLVSGQSRSVSSHEGINASPAFSPDGTTLALTRSTGGDADIWLIDAKTGKALRRVTSGGGIDVAPCFSPDGRYLVFSSERSGGSQIYLQDLQTRDPPQRVTQRQGWFSDPVFSPDGSLLAFVARDGHFDIFVSDLEGRNMIRLTQDAGNNEDPSWSPDGRYLTFTSTRDGRSDIWVSTANGNYQAPITRNGGWSQPTWTH